MPLMHDPSLTDQAGQVQETFQTARAALPKREAGSLDPSALPVTSPMPEEVVAAQEEFRRLWAVEHGSTLDLQIVQYFRHVNNELVEGWSDEEGPGPNAVQISQTISITSPEGAAYLEIRQWIARVEARP